MFIFGIFFQALALLVEGVCRILYWLLFARIVLSWLPVDPYHGVVQFLMQVTEPLLAPFRRLPMQIGTFDLSPLVAFFALYFIQAVLVQTLYILARQLGVV